MKQELMDRLLRHLNDVGCTEDDIIAGIDYADRNGYDDADDALSIVVAHILYGPNECDSGARFPVERGTEW